MAACGEFRDWIEHQANDGELVVSDAIAGTCYRYLGFVCVCVCVCVRVVFFFWGVESCFALNPNEVVNTPLSFFLCAWAGVVCQSSGGLVVAPNCRPQWRPAMCYFSATATCHPPPRR